VQEEHRYPNPPRDGPYRDYFAFFARFFFTRSACVRSRSRRIAASGTLKMFRTALPNRGQ